MNGMIKSFCVKVMTECVKCTESTGNQRFQFYQPFVTKDGHIFLQKDECILAFAKKSSDVT